MNRNKIIALNIIQIMEFVIKLYRDGKLDKRLMGELRLVEDERLGYTKREAASVLFLSERQFDRLIKLGKIKHGTKKKGYSTLFWERDYINELSNKDNL